MGTEHYFGIIITLFGVLFLAVIGVYGWTTKQLGKIYEVVNGHLQNTKVHTSESDDFVATKLCNQIHTTVKEDLTEIKKDVKSLLAKAV